MSQKKRRKKKTKKKGISRYVTLISWLTMEVPFAVHVVPVTAAGFTTRLAGSRPWRGLEASPLGRAKAIVAERRMVKRVDAYMATFGDRLKNKNKNAALKQ
jgi:hypothetical protein